MYEVYYFYLLFHVVPKYEESKTMWTIVFPENVLGILMSCSLHGFIDCGSHWVTRRDAVSLFFCTWMFYHIVFQLYAVVLYRCLFGLWQNWGYLHMSPSYWKSALKKRELFLMIVIHFHFLSYCGRIRVDKLSHFIVYPIL